MTPFCLVVSGGSQAKDNDDALLDVVLMFNGGPFGAKGYIERRFLFNTYVPESRHFESIWSHVDEDPIHDCRNYAWEQY
jgi:hypothetical protein